MYRERARESSHYGSLGEKHKITPHYFLCPAWTSLKTLSSFTLSTKLIWRNLSEIPRHTGRSYSQRNNTWNIDRGKSCPRKCFFLMLSWVKLSWVKVCSQTKQGEKKIPHEATCTALYSSVSFSPLRCLFNIAELLWSLLVYKQKQRKMCRSSWTHTLNSLPCAVRFNENLGFKIKFKPWINNKYFRM